MPHRDWNASYASNQLPWDTGHPDPHLVDLIREGRVTGRALEIGCGTGTNALWLASHGLDVLAIDLAPLAIERARDKARANSVGHCEFQTRDFLADDSIAGPFQLVFDRGCFHVFDEAADRARFAARVSKVLAPGGLWLSLMGSTEGAPRETGPPRRSVRDIAAALEPYLEIVTLRSTEFERLPGEETAPKAWLCLSRRRDQPAQPSTQA